MEEDLDHILLDQYHVSKHIGKKMARARLLMGDDPLLLEFQELNKNRTKFYESMITNKKLLRKKKKKIKSKSHDLLARHPLVDMYKYVWMSTYYSYNMMMESVRGFMSFYKKDNNEKNDNQPK